MSKDYEDLISAQVVLNPAGISTAASVIAEFDRAGFRTGPLIANSFSIEASREHFEKFFRVVVQRGARGGVLVTEPGAQSPLGLQLPLGALPPNVRTKVLTILFSAPPAFGPTGTFA
jgi:hypothetical protein